MLVAAKLWAFMGKLVLNAAGKLAFSEDPCCCNEPCCPDITRGIIATFGGDAWLPFVVPLTYGGEQGVCLDETVGWGADPTTVPSDLYCGAETPGFFSIDMLTLCCHPGGRVYSTDLVMEDVDNVSPPDIILVQCHPFKVVVRYTVVDGSTCVGETFTITFTYAP